MFRSLIYILLAVSGCYGAYGFALDGVDNPVVWALDGAEAPFFWGGLIGLIIVYCLKRVNLKEIK
jgi:hypothetical protein